VSQLVAEASSTPIEMVPSAVTAKEIVIVLSFRTNGSSPPAALATAARIVSMASTRTSPRAPSRVSARSFSPGGVRLADESWRSAFESVFLGAVRLARILAADLGGAGVRVPHAGGRGRLHADSGSAVQPAAPSPAAGGEAADPPPGMTRLWTRLAYPRG
jgi:hypothetical protein